MNSELGNNLGNFIKRVSDLLHKFYDGVVPEYNHGLIDNYFLEAETPLYFLDIFKFKEAMNSVMNLSRAGNEFLQKHEPWKLIKQDEETTRDVMFTIVQTVGQIAFHLKYLLPKTSKKIENIL